MFKTMKVEYRNTSNIDEKFDRELIDFIQKKTGMLCYASGYSHMDGWRDMVFDNREEKE